MLAAMEHSDAVPPHVIPTVATYLLPAHYPNAPYTVTASAENNKTSHTISRPPIISSPVSDARR